MNLVFKILGAVGVAGTALCSAGVIPGAFAVVFTLVGTVAAALHPSPMAAPVASK